MISSDTMTMFEFAGIYWIYIVNNAYNLNIDFTWRDDYKSNELQHLAD